MEINQMYNRDLRENLFNAALGVLFDNNLIQQEDLKDLGVTVGYMFSKDDGQIEALFKIFAGKEFIFAAQNGKLMMVDITPEMFEQTVGYMKSTHPCLLNEDLPETDVQKKRREKNNKTVSKLGIATADRLMTRWEDDSVVLKDIETLCKRAIASFFVIQIACDIGKDNYKEGLDYFKPLIEKYGVMDQLNSKEQRIIDGSYSMQDAIDMDWAYEALWSLLWCLGLIKDKEVSDGSSVCDCDKAIKLIMNSNSTEDLMKKCNLRSKAEILDMLDLYFRYNWAINDAKLHPESSTGNLHPSIVIERRRGLEWAVTDIEDWYDIDMRA